MLGLCFGIFPITYTFVQGKTRIARDYFYQFALEVVLKEYSKKSVVYKSMRDERLWRKRSVTKV